MSGAHDFLVGALRREASCAFTRGATSFTPFSSPRCPGLPGTAPGPSFSPRSSWPRSRSHSRISSWRIESGLPSGEYTLASAPPTGSWESFTERCWVISRRRSRSGGQSRPPWCFRPLRCPGNFGGLSRPWRPACSSPACGIWLRLMASRRARGPGGEQRPDSMGISNRRARRLRALWCIVRYNLLR